MKKFWKYFVIVLLLLLGVFAVGVLYLFFVPNSSLFGITYISYNETSKSKEVYDQNDVDSIVLSSNNYKVNILPSATGEISLKVLNNSLGFVHKNNSKLTISEKLENKQLTFNVVEPHGFAIMNSSYINIYLPSKSFDLTINNNRATTLIEDQATNIGNLKYSANTGYLNITKANIGGELDLNINHSTVTIQESAKLNKNNVKFSVKTGKFEAKTSNLGNFTIKDNDMGIINIKECEVLTQSKKYCGGRIQAQKVQSVNISSSDTHISIKSVENGATINLTHFGSITIDELKGSSSLTTNNGKIVIKKSNANITCKSNNGLITIENAKQSISATSKNSNISIKFDETAESFDSNNSSRKVVAQTDNGKISISGAENINATLNGNGSLDLSLKNVYGTNSIVCKNNSSVKIVVNDEAEYVLTTKSTNGNVKVNILPIPEFDGYKTKEERETYVNCTNSENTLVVTTENGSLTILDTKLS